MASKYCNQQWVKATVKGWMERSQFVLISKSWQGYEKVYTDADEAVEDIGKHIFELYLYNPNPHPSGRGWYCLQAVYNQYNDLWEIDKGKPSCKKTKKVL